MNFSDFCFCLFLMIRKKNKSGELVKNWFCLQLIGSNHWTFKELNCMY